MCLSIRAFPDADSFLGLRRASSCRAEELFILSDTAKPDIGHITRMRTEDLAMGRNALALHTIFILTYLNVPENSPLRMRAHTSGATSPPRHSCGCEDEGTPIQIRINRPEDSKVLGLSSFFNKYSTFHQTFVEFSGQSEPVLLLTLSTELFLAVVLGLYLGPLFCPAPCSP